MTIKTDNSPTDNLEKLFMLQKSMMGLCGIDTSKTITIFEPLFKDVAIMLVQEVMEVLSPLTLSTKEWKQGEEQESIIANVKEELIDCMFFLIELYELIGMTPEDVMKQYEQKWAKNVRRIAKKDAGVKRLFNAGVPIALYHDELFLTEQGRQLAKSPAIESIKGRELIVANQLLIFLSIELSKADDDNSYENFNLELVKIEADLMKKLDFINANLGEITFTNEAEGVMNILASIQSLFDESKDEKSEFEIKFDEFISSLKIQKFSDFCYAHSLK